MKVREGGGGHSKFIANFGHRAASIFCVETPVCDNEKPLKCAVFQRFSAF